MYRKFRCGLREPLFLLAALVISTTFAQPASGNWSDRFYRTGTDGVVWSMHTVGDTIYAGGALIKAGGLTVNCISKYDGRTWSAMGNGLTSTQNSVSDIDSYGGFVYACDKVGLHRWNGSTWTQVGVLGGLPAAELNAVAIAIDATGQVYMTGNFLSVNGVSANRVARYDGTTWHAMGSGIVQPQPGLGNYYSTAMAAIGNEVYLAGAMTQVGGVTVNNVARWNGSTWSAMAGGIPTYGTPKTLAVVNGQLHVGTGAIGPNGGPYTANVLRWTGTAWSVVGSSFNLDVEALVERNGVVHASGAFTAAGGQPVNHVARLSGSSWVDAGNPFDLQYARSLAHCTHGLYVGGITNLTDQTDMHNIVRFDGTRWRNVGDGVGFPTFGTQYVNAVLCHNGQTYIAGKFDQVGGVRSHHVAQWDGDQWMDIGLPFAEPSRVNAMVMKGDTLIIGGSFTVSNPPLIRHLAMRVNGVWLPMGTGADDEVFALALHNNELYIGGEFSTLNGVGCSAIGKWNGTQFSPVGSGANNTVRAIAFGPDGTLYAGGGFTNMGGVTCNRMAKWNGTAWSSVASGVNNWVNTIDILTDGSPVFGGQFNIAINGGLVNGVARFNGTSLVAMGPGLTGNVYDIEVNNGQVFACGAFTLSGTTTVNNVARWNGTNAWEPLGAGLAADPLETSTAMGMDMACDVLTVGGYFSTAGGKRADRVSSYTFNLPALNAADAVVCAGGELQLTVNGVDPAVVTTVQWLVNGQPATGSGLTFTSSTLANGSTIQAVVTMDLACGDPVVRSSNSVQVQVVGPGEPTVLDNGNVLSVQAPVPGYSYVWQVFIGGQWTNVVPAATGTTFDYTQAGTYRVNAIQGGCVRSSAPITVVITAVNELGQTAFTVFPNPVRDRVELRAPAPIQRVQLLDAAGRTVLQEQRVATGRTATIDLGHLANGTYVLVVDMQGGTGHCRVVVDH
jgi:hypothetical protein